MYGDATLQHWEIIVPNLMFSNKLLKLTTFFYFVLSLFNPHPHYTAIDGQSTNILASVLYQIYNIFVVQQAPDFCLTYLTPFFYYVSSLH